MTRPCGNALRRLRDGDSVAGDRERFTHAARGAQQHEKREARRALLSEPVTCMLVLGAGGRGLDLGKKKDAVPTCRGAARGLIFSAPTPALVLVFGER